MDSIHSKALLKFLLYLTAHHPEEFGLIPTRSNFFKIKEIFQVLIFTKNLHNLKLNTLKYLFSYYFRNFFEFLEEHNLVRPKESFFSPPREINFSEIVKFKYNPLFTFVKPRVWYKITLDGEVPLKDWHPLFVERELAENWAKIKGALLIEVNPRFLPEDGKYKIFGDTILLTQVLNFKACKGPKIDEKFINKFLKEKSHPEKVDPYIIPFKPLKIESEKKEEDTPFRKITFGKKKEKPWKTWQKKKQKEREI